MRITITAKQDGYCRCNTIFRDFPVVFLRNHFTPGQLAQLKADPNLIIREADQEQGKHELPPEDDPLWKAAQKKKGKK